ncbi:methyltransferase [Paramagnetospirillum marisnigri]|uniref:Methyltransferase n=1 Tax=Paramagnetospirillum marisnigri TaxID=1285242 RepID=A0A178MLL3_9PROT|nr:methyltransferase [Paramagnetospirillum marisnigri]OAN49590.1 methyltransferase [Paramagnetospirillum marisnigri]
MHAITDIDCTRDTLLDGRVMLTQPRNGYRAAVDPVLLAAAIAARPGDRVLDLGCGVGAAALCLMARVPGLDLVGLEIQPHLAGLARVNAEANGQAGFQVEEGSAAQPLHRLGSFDHVITNPPYVAQGRGTAPPTGSKALAHMEGELALEGWISAAARRLRPKGVLTVIHRADRLDELLAALAARGLGEVRIRPVWPRASEAAGRVVVSGRKGSRAPLALLPGLVLHQGDGGYTAEAEAILRHAGVFE